MRGRLIGLRVVSLIIFIALLARLQQLQFGSSAATSRASIEQNITRHDYIAPQRGEIFASDGTTLLAASVPTSLLGIQAESLPRKRADRNAVYMRLSMLLPFSDTFTLSPTTKMQEDPALAAAVYGISPILPADTSFAPHQSITVTVPMGKALTALQLSKAYTDVITLQPGVEKALAKANLPSYLVVPVAKNIPNDVALAIRENALALPGVRVVDGFQRDYPLSAETKSLSHLLGYMIRINDKQLARYNPLNDADGPRQYLESDLIGVDGIENYYESTLRGKLGTNQISVDVWDRIVGEPKVLQPMEDGKNLILNIDMDLQRDSEQILQKWLDIADQRRVRLANTPGKDQVKYASYDRINKGVIMVMDVNTGAVLASVSLPAYDNNAFNRGEVEEITDLFTDEENTPLLHRAIAGKYPPGSTFKQFTAAAALDSDIINPDSRIQDPGFLLVRNEYNEALTNQYPNSNRRANGLINVSDALKVSSNVFFNTVAGGTDYVTNLKPNDPQIKGGLGIDRLYETVSGEFGFDKLTGIDLPGEDSGIIPNKEWKKQRRERWGVGDTYIAAIGQGDVQVTPLQLLRATVATANRGTVYQPQVVKAITDLNRTDTITLTPVIEHTINLAPEHWAVIREGMRRSVRDSDAYNRIANSNNKPAGAILADLDRLDLAGKTGTAEYAEGPYLRSHSWFVGFAPFDNPKVAILAMLEGTGDLGDGSGTLALPAVVDVLRAYNGEGFPDINGNMPAPAAGSTGQ
ncbi:penicillin-binding transpeptidase domain-containing protein [Herpetosiphon giganteus]|uniref:penicillin-binding transpeptidase domain-containing protein n=1 Tax=Herpetosiphon giganteus TaxID=2029754 RepID=UPI0019560819|nr:penicillin-binding transpeptidase domain-containing protein [Herpetosiphon giganteus]MBM7841686.1 penicillin-binding protein 2 [Herpetosiphon giganteus]